jgi:hypothetical protein
MELLSPDPHMLHRAFRELSTTGAASLPIMAESEGAPLLLEARGYSYAREPEVVGREDRRVFQQMGSFESFPRSSLFLELKVAFQLHMDSYLTTLEDYPFETKWQPNSLVLQKYEEGSLGITAHRDHKKYINLICVFILGGYGEFFICEDRSGRGSLHINAYPGSVVLMRAPGFKGPQRRPFHYVTNIREKRYTFGLRQLKDSDSLSGR